MVPVTKDQILNLAPDARPAVLGALRSLDADLALYGINATARRLTHFLAQLLEETGGFTALYENLNYSSEGLRRIFGRYFRAGTKRDPEAFAHHPQKIANLVYGQRLGNTGPDDGWIYRGRGLIQLTGKDNYSVMRARLAPKFPNAPDFAANPDLVNDPEWIFRVPATFWNLAHCNDAADADDIEAVTRKVNGGLINLPARKDWLTKCRAVWA